jgi:hypothetical protein
MNGYEPSTPRAALGLIAVAMAAITMGALVVLPAKLDSLDADPSTVAAVKSASEAPIEVATGPARIGAPEAEDREAHVHAGRAILGAQEFRGSGHRLSSRSRTAF